MGININEIKDHKLRERIQRQCQQEDAAKVCQPVVELGQPEPQPGTPKALVNRDAPGKSRATRPLVVVTLVSYRKRKLDWSNLVAGFKDLQDDLAHRLGVDDGHEHIVQYEYDQIVTAGQTGTQILITTL